MVEPCSNQPSSSPLLTFDVAGKLRAARASGVEHEIEEMQADARHQNGRDRHQRQRVAGFQPCADHRALVLAEQPLDPLQRDRIDVPGVAMDQRDPLDMRVMRRVEAVIHARRQPQA